jgi:hypothetical protein
LCFHNVQLSPLPKHSHNKQTLTTIRAALPLLCIQQTEELFFYVSPAVTTTTTKKERLKISFPSDVKKVVRQESSFSTSLFFVLFVALLCTV